MIYEGNYIIWRNLFKRSRNNQCTSQQDNENIYCTMEWKTNIVLPAFRKGRKEINKGLQRDSFIEACPQDYDKYSSEQTHGIFQRKEDSISIQRNNSTALRNGKPILQ